MNVMWTESGKVLLPLAPSWCTVDEADAWLHDTLTLLHQGPPDTGLDWPRGADRQHNLAEREVHAQRDHGDSVD